MVQSGSKQDSPQLFKKDDQGGAVFVYAGKAAKVAKVGKPHKGEPVATSQFSGATSGSQQRQGAGAGSKFLLRLDL